MRTHDDDREATPDVVWSNGHWAVTAFGLEARGSMPYAIPKPRLAEIYPGQIEPIAMWPIHLVQKTWVDPEMMWPAFEAALRHHVPAALSFLDLVATRQRMDQICEKRRC